MKSDKIPKCFPGLEPEIIKPLIASFTEELNKVCEDKIIEWPDSWNSQWDSTVRFLTSELGYSSEKKFLEAYGYTIVYVVQDESNSSIAVSKSSLDLSENTELKSSFSIQKLAVILCAMLCCAVIIFFVSRSYISNQSFPENSDVVAYAATISDDKDNNLNEFLTVETTDEPVLESAAESIHEFSSAETAFNIACNLKESDLKKDFTGLYSYHGLPLSTLDVCSSDTLGFCVNSSALYNGIALEMIRNTIPVNTYKVSDQLFKILLGKEKGTDQSVFSVVANRFSKYIVYDGSEREILRAFEFLDCVEGTFNYDAREYSFRIKDLTAAAHELGITDEMLGYMLAYLALYVYSYDDYVWDSNSLSLSFAVHANVTVPEKSFSTFNPSYRNGDMYILTSGDYVYDLNARLSFNGYNAHFQENNGVCTGIISNDYGAEVGIISFLDSKGKKVSSSDFFSEIQFEITSTYADSDSLLCALLASLDPSKNYDDIHTTYNDIFEKSVVEEENAKFLLYSNETDTTLIIDFSPKNDKVYKSAVSNILINPTKPNIKGQTMTCRSFLSVISTRLLDGLHATGFDENGVFACAFYDDWGAINGYFNFIDSSKSYLSSEQSFSGIIAKINNYSSKIYTVLIHSCDLSLSPKDAENLYYDLQKTEPSASVSIEKNGIKYTLYKNIPESVLLIDFSGSLNIDDIDVIPVQSNMDKLDYKVFLDTRIPLLLRIPSVFSEENITAILGNNYTCLKDEEGNTETYSVVYKDVFNSVLHVIVDADTNLVFDKNIKVTCNNGVYFDCIDYLTSKYGDCISHTGSAFSNNPHEVSVWKDFSVEYDQVAQYTACFIISSDTYPNASLGTQYAQLNHTQTNDEIQECLFCLNDILDSFIYFTDYLKTLSASSLLHWPNDSKFVELSVAFHKHSEQIKFYKNYFDTYLPDSSLKKSWNGMLNLLAQLGKGCDKVVEFFDAFSNPLYQNDQDKLANYCVSVLEDASSVFTNPTLISDFKTAFEAEKSALSQSHMNSDSSFHAQTLKPFTNKYGTESMKCAHSGCNNYIASSGDTNCCTVHSNKCLDCGCYIDEDALYCIDCIAKAMNNAHFSTQSSSHKCQADGCNKDGSYSITGLFGTTEHYCFEHYSKLKSLYGAIS